MLSVNDFGIWILQAIRASTYENFTGPKVNWPKLKEIERK